MGYVIRGVILLSIIFSVFSIVSAVCSDDQTILKLSADTNAHGELWNGTGNYGTRICYNDTFGYNYGGSNPHDSNGNNLVLLLSSATNAHAGVPGATGYTFGVNYGDLNCRYVTGNCDSSLGEKELLRLYANTNSHLAVAGTASYPIAICCKSGRIGNVYWADGSGNPISQSCINKTVFLVAETSAVSVNYEIYRRGLLSDAGVRTKSAGNALSASGNGIKTIASWKIKDSDVSGTNSFYFNASTFSGSNSTGSYLTVSPSACGNLKPFAVISSPTHRQMYFANVPISFNESSFDLDGLIVSWNWTIESQSGVEYSTTSRSFSYTFANAGQRTITLKVTDDGGKSDETQIAIVELASPGMLAFINQPMHRQMMINENLYSKGNAYVFFNASDSYVVNSVGSGCGVVISCLAGICPAQTMNAPAGCTSTIGVSGTPQDFSKLYFAWGFDGNGPDANSQGLGLGTLSHLYTNGGDKVATLYLNYSDGTIAIRNIFVRLFGLNSQCRGGTLLFLNDSRGFLDNPVDTSDSGTGCAGADGIVNTTDDCCQAGFYCTSKGCALIPPSNNTRSDCGRYNDQSSCEADNLGAARAGNYPVLWSANPACGSQKISNGQSITTTCACDWNSAATGDKCTLVKNQINSTISYDNGGTVYNVPESSCSYQWATGEEQGGLCTVSAKATCLLGTCTDCNDMAPYNVPCGRSEVKLPFFGWLQFIESIMAIAFVYFIVGRKKS